MCDLTTFARAMLADLTRPDAPAVPEPSRYAQMQHPVTGDWYKIDLSTGRVVGYRSVDPFDDAEIVGEPVARAPAVPVDGDPADQVARVPPEDGTGRVRAPQRPEPIRAETLFEPGKRVAFETVLRLARETHALIWDAALAIVRAAPPMPTPWASSIGVEPDCEYRFRIIESETCDFTRDRAECASFLAASGRDLDRYGERAGVQRRIIP